MTKSPATCWNAGRFIGVIIRVRRSTRQCCPGVERIRVSRRAAIFFLLATSYRTWQGSKWSSAQPEARGGGVGRRERGREQKRGRELLEKRRGTSASLYQAKDWAGNESGQRPYRTRRGGQPGTGSLNRMG